MPIAWFAGGRLADSQRTKARAPLLLLGADSYGRDVFARVLYGARISLALSLAAAIGATLLGSLLGAPPGMPAGRSTTLLMRGSEFVLVLPTMYVALALRAVLPLVLPAGAVFALLAGIFAVVGAPFISRGVRGIVRSERQRRLRRRRPLSLGAGHARILAAAPAAGRRAASSSSRSTMLVPAFIVAEATLSYVGLGFPRADRELGHDAAGRVDRPRDRRFPVAAQSGGGDVRRRARSQPRDAAAGHRAGLQCVG